MALSKRKRATYFRYAQYGLLVLIALVVAFTANWSEILHTFFDLKTAGAMFPVSGSSNRTPPEQTGPYQ